MVKASEKAKALSKEYNRIITQANHRLKRLEKGGWQESPAYKNIGGKKLSFLSVFSSISEKLIAYARL